MYSSDPAASFLEMTEAITLFSMGIYLAGFLAAGLTILAAVGSIPGKSRTAPFIRWQPGPFPAAPCYLANTSAWRPCRSPIPPSLPQILRSMSGQSKKKRCLSGDR